jgi:hypothetical protein
MTSRTMEVIVSPKGETSIETRGFAGSSCQQASRFLEQALGVQASEKFTVEFYQQETAPQRVQQGGAA